VNNTTKLAQFLVESNLSLGWFARAADLAESHSSKRFHVASETLQFSIGLMKRTGTRSKRGARSQCRVSDAKSTRADKLALIRTDRGLCLSVKVKSRPQRKRCEQARP
jgi:hypothetical protein